MCPTKLLTAFRIPRIAITVLRIGASSWLIVAMSETVPATSEARPVQAPTPGHTREISRPARTPATKSPGEERLPLGRGRHGGLVTAAWRMGPGEARDLALAPRPTPARRSTCRSTLSGLERGEVRARLLRLAAQARPRRARALRWVGEQRTRQHRAGVGQHRAAVDPGRPAAVLRAERLVAHGSGERAGAADGRDPRRCGGGADSSSGTAASASWSAACSVTDRGPTLTRRDDRLRQALGRNLPRMVHFSAFEALTFDCYGTLIDWETGLADALPTALGGGDREDLHRPLRPVRGGGRGRSVHDLSRRADPRAARGRRRAWRRGEGRGGRRSRRRWATGPRSRTPPPRSRS